VVALAISAAPAAAQSFSVGVHIGNGPVYAPAPYYPAPYYAPYAPYAPYYGPYYPPVYAAPVYRVPVYRQRVYYPAYGYPAAYGPYYRPAYRSGGVVVNGYNGGYRNGNHGRGPARNGRHR
jgi:hypothetical protein